MTPNERHALVTQIFLDEVCSLPPDERGPALDERCAGDASLRAEIQRMLERDKAEDAPIDKPALGPGFELRADDSTDTPGDSSVLPERIGDFRILNVLGAGSMGVVYLAEQERPRRRVALKVLRPGPASERTLHRFEREAEILARLQHPGIAQVYATGTVDTGYGPQPYFALEYVEGRPLLEHVNATSLDVRGRLALLLALCDAAQHAHQRGIIHRDLKPGNILVVASGQPKILDFGVARITDADIGTMTMHTQVGQLIGTVPYMSPEQAAGDVDDIDTRSDVYALGVIGFELLSGRLPYRLEGRLVHEAARIIREDDPDSLGSVDRSLRGDLDAVLGKALEKGKTRRYQSASELAADIRHYLDDEPVEAHRTGTLGRLRKTMRRHRVMSAVTITALLMLVVGAAATTWMAVIAREQRDLAQEARDEADRRFRQVQELAVGLTQAVVEGMDAVGGNAEVQSGLLDQTVTQLNTLALDRPEDKRLRLLIALKHAELGTRQFDLGAPSLGDLSGALTSYRQSIEIADEVLAQDGGDVTAQLIKADALHRMAVAQDIEAHRSPARRKKLLESADQAAAMAEALISSDMSRRARRLLSLALRSAARLCTGSDDYAGAEARIRRALSVAEELLDEDPADLELQHLVSLSSEELGRVLQQRGAQADALSQLERARQIRERLAPGSVTRERELATIDRRIAESLLALGRTEEAVALARRSEQAAVGFAALDPTNVAARRSACAAKHSLARALAATRQFAEAQAKYEEHIGIAKALRGDYPDEVTLLELEEQGVFELGEFLRFQGRHAEAREYLQRMVDLRQELVAFDDNPITRREVALGYERVAHTYSGEDKPEEALRSYLSGLEIIQQLHEESPDDQRVMRDLGVFLTNVGNQLKAISRHEEAIERYREGLEVRRRLARLRPDDLRAQDEEALNLYLIAKGPGVENAQAIEHMRESIAISEMLTERAPESAKFRSETAVKLYALGRLHASAAAEHDLSNPDRLAAWRQAVEYQRRAKAIIDAMTSDGTMPASYAGLASAVAGEIAEAEEAIAQLQTSES